MEKEKPAAAVFPSQGAATGLIVSSEIQTQAQSNLYQLWLELFEKDKCLEGPQIHSNCNIDVKYSVQHAGLQFTCRRSGSFLAAALRCQTA